jgi:hypothetical protein
MKSFFVNLDDEIFYEAEEIVCALGVDRNRYFNEAISIYNQANKLRLFKAQLAIESAITSQDSMDILHEFEKLIS